LQTNFGPSRELPSRKAAQNLLGDHLAVHGIDPNAERAVVPKSALCEVVVFVHHTPTIVPLKAAPMRALRRGEPSFSVIVVPDRAERGGLPQAMMLDRRQKLLSVGSFGQEDRIPALTVFLSKERESDDRVANWNTVERVVAVGSFAWRITCFGARWRGPRRWRSSWG
jgi:hypothetical protein